MNWKLTHRLVAGAVFVYAFVLYLVTMAPTVSFWDAGEFIAAVEGLQVGHPPGAPFYMLLGRLFTMWVPTAWIAPAVTLISVLASALTILLAHLIIVRLVRKWRPLSFSDWTGGDHISALTGGVIGACTFAVTDSFWFNAVEAEVYALSMFFTAIVVWLIMEWSERAQREEEMIRGGSHPFGLRANRYLVLIAYLFGLAIGVHLLNLLAIFFIALIVFFTEFDRPEWTRRERWLRILAAGGVSAVVFLVIYPGMVQILPELAGNSGMPMVFIFGLLALVAFGVYITHQREMRLANLVMLCIAVVLIGYSTYALIFIRSAADPAIDLNDPETPEEFVSYLNREQYGSPPLLKGVTFDDARGAIGQEEKLFPRRYSTNPQHWQVYRQYDSDWEFFLEYQIGHMYLRYFLWNFSGRSSDLRDAPAITGFQFVDETIIEDPPLFTTPSETASRNAYYLLPLLLGLIGAGLHFHYDWRRAFAVLVLFLLTGLGIILYLNQTPIQPRERDYSYVASFFAFSLWVGIGAAGILELARDAMLQKKEKLGAAARRGILLAAGVFVFAAVPGWMLQENYFDHDRSGRSIAHDYAYNMLMSVAENAVLFTNGDNDTYPLWYLQEVEDVRTDVRVVNLSLLNTPWYVQQLKNQAAHESAPVPMSIPDDRIDQLGFVRWQPREVTLPVNPASFREQVTEVPIPAADSLQLEDPMTWTLPGRRYNENVNFLYGADVVALDILQSAAAEGWERPVYFAVTVARDGQLNLQNYFQMEGMSFRVVPIRHEVPMGRIVPTVSVERLENFRFGNLNDPDVYFNATIRNMVDNYRNIFAHTASGLAKRGMNERGIALLDRLMTEVPFATVPGDFSSILFLSRAYQDLGASQRAFEVMQQAEPIALDLARQERLSSRERSLFQQYVQLIRFTYLRANAYEETASFMNKLADALGDNRFRTTPEALQQQMAPGRSDTAPGLAPPSQGQIAPSN